MLSVQIWGVLQDTQLWQTLPLSCSDPELLRLVLHVWCTAGQLALLLPSQPALAALEEAPVGTLELAVQESTDPAEALSWH